MTIFADLVIRITREILNPLIVLVFLLAVAAFAWGMVMYLSAQGSDDKVQKGKKIMWFGIIGMFVLASIWGIVALLCDFFGTCEAGFSAPSIPSVTAPPPSSAGEWCDFPPCTNGNTNGNIGSPPSETQLTPAEQVACLNSPIVCEPCRHFLDEGRPREYVRCVRNILRF